MKRLKSLKRRYFSLHTIMLIASLIRLSAIKTAIFATAIFSYFAIVSDEDDPPEDEKLCLHTPALCVCSYIFTARTKVALWLSFIYKLPPCSCRLHKSGISPPNLFLINK